jgi:hypothetical protein
METFLLLLPIWRWFDAATSAGRYGEALAVRSGSYNASYISRIIHNYLCCRNSSTPFECYNNQRLESMQSISHAITKGSHSM